MKILAIALAFTFAFFKAEAPAYSFQLKSITGKDFNLAQYKGKKILIVNTASKCGYTPQYKELEKLYETYKDKLVIVGFPANNFGGQEPGSGGYRRDDRPRLPEASAIEFKARSTTSSSASKLA